MFRLFCLTLLLCAAAAGAERFTGEDGSVVTLVADKVDGFWYPTLDAKRRTNADYAVIEFHLRANGERRNHEK